MSYDLTEEQRMLRETIARLAKENIAPVVLKKEMRKAGSPGIWWIY